MSADSEPCIQELGWAAVRDVVRKAAPDFAAIVDEINPPANCKLVRVKYPFGAKIVDNGLCNLLTEHGAIYPISDTRLPKHFKEKLDYNPVPLGIVMDKNVEVYREMDDRVYSIAAYNSGFDLGIWEYFGWTTPYSVSAGARSLYMLPKITLTPSHNKLKREFNVRLPAPKQPSDHWHVFRQISASPNFVNSWFCEVFYLTKDWVEKIEQDKKWSKLKYFLTQKGWQHSAFGRRHSIFAVVWQMFAKALSEKGLKPNPYVLDTLKHLVFVGTGGSPASAPAHGGDLNGPITELQKIYIDTYKLEYIPTIMQPQIFNFEKDSPVYYSLQTPTLMESVPKSRNLTSIVDNIRELKELTDHFLSEAFDEHLRIHNQPINALVEKLEFDFFHGEAFAYGQDVRPSKEMPDKDKRLLFLPEGSEEKAFSESGSFVRGCVRIGVRVG